MAEYGKKYYQYKHKPKKAIMFLKKHKAGACIAAMRRDDIGDIDIIWGENDPKTNKGYGLKHIIEKHGKDIKALGFEVEDFIPIVVQFGAFDQERSTSNRRVYSNDKFRFVVVVEETVSGQRKWLLTSFDINKKRK